MIFLKVFIIKKKGGDTLMSELQERVELGTWGFLKTGWWVLHVVGILIVGYLGYWIAKM